jgi:hypothetical protein
MCPNSNLKAQVSLNRDSEALVYLGDRARARAHPALPASDGRPGPHEGTEAAASRQSLPQFQVASPHCPFLSCILNLCWIPTCDKQRVPVLDENAMLLRAVETFDYDGCFIIVNDSMWPNGRL